MKNWNPNKNGPAQLTVRLHGTFFNTYNTILVDKNIILLTNTVGQRLKEWLKTTFLGNDDLRIPIATKKLGSESIPPDYALSLSSKVKWKSFGTFSHLNSIPFAVIVGFPLFYFRLITTRKSRIHWIGRRGTGRQFKSLWCLGFNETSLSLISSKYLIDCILNIENLICSLNQRGETKIYGGPEASSTSAGPAISVFDNGRQ